MKREYNLSEEGMRMSGNIVKKCIKCPTWAISIDGNTMKCPNCNSELIKEQFEKIKSISDIRK